MADKPLGAQKVDRITKLLQATGQSQADAKAAAEKLKGAPSK